MIEFTSYASGSTGNLYKATSDDTCSLMIEAGITPDRVMQAFNYQVSSIAGALISHSHQDHCKSIEDVARLGIDCYMTRETARDLNFDQAHRLKIITPMKKFSVDRFQVIAFPTIHDCPGSVGFLVADREDKLLYATDTYYISNKFKGLTIIAIECNWSKETWNPDIDLGLKRRIESTHLSLEVVKDFLTANDLRKVREIHLLHMSNSNSNAEYFKTEIQKLTGKPVVVD